MSEGYTLTIPVGWRNALSFSLILVQIVVLCSETNIDGFTAWFGFSILIRVMMFILSNRHHQIASNNCEATMLVTILGVMWVLPIVWLGYTSGGIRIFFIYSIPETVLYYFLIFTIRNGDVKVPLCYNDTIEQSEGPYIINEMEHVVTIGELESQ